MGKTGMVPKGVVLCLLAALGSGCDYGAIKKKNTALETAIKGLQAEKEAQQRELAHLKSTNDQLGAQLSTSQQRTQGLQKDNSRLTGQVGLLSQQNSTLKAQPVKVQAKPVTPMRSKPFAVKGTTVTQEAGRIRVRLSNSLLFDPGKARLRKGARTTLAQIGNILKSRYRKSVVGVEGHTDSTPVVRSKKSFADNHDLSIQRARAVFDYLKTTAGIPESRLFVAGYGAIHPEASNKTRQGRAQNRRVEIIIYTQ